MSFVCNSDSTKFTGWKALLPKGSLFSESPLLELMGHRLLVELGIRNGDELTTLVLSGEALYASIAELINVLCSCALTANLLVIARIQGTPRAMASSKRSERASSGLQLLDW
jgi:hypothetical protein